MTYLAIILMIVIIILILILIIEQRSQKRLLEGYKKLNQDQAEYIKKLEADFKRLSQSYSKNF